MLKWARLAALAAGIVLVMLLAGCQGPSSSSCDPLVYGDLPCL